MTSIDLPHTYTDSREDRIIVGRDPSGLRIITVHEWFGDRKHMATVYAPTGENAVSLSCAILDIAGDTGHRIVSEEHLQDREAIAHAPVVHMDLPEGLTPCGPGAQNVTTDTRLDRVTCLECLRNLARTRHGDVLRSENMVEPGDEVPDLCEMAGRVAAIEQRLDAIESAYGPGAHPLAERQIGAQLMRERALQAISDAWGTGRTATELIRALPLLPEDEETR